MLYNDLRTHRESLRRTGNRRVPIGRATCRGPTPLRRIRQYRMELDHRVFEHCAPRRIVAPAEARRMVEFPVPETLNGFIERVTTGNRLIGLLRQVRSGRVALATLLER